MTIAELTQPDRWGERILAGLPIDLQRQARERWVQVANDGPKYPGVRHSSGLAPHALANLELGALRRELAQIKFSVATEDADIVEAARKVADLCERRNFSGHKIVEHFGIEPEWKKETEEGKRRRFCDPAWWRRKLRAHVGRQVEESMRRRALVRRGRALYLTDWSLRRWRGKRSAARHMLENSVVVNEEGTQLDLLEVSQKSVSNPENRRKEMMLRAKGFERQASANGYTWTFATLSCPSAFHPQLEAGGDNPRYEQFTVRDGQQWLCDRWGNSRSTFKRECLVVFGFRVAEPHHDGTPHWHGLFFVKADQVDRLEEILRDEWLSEYGGERGAQEYRVKFKREDKNVPGGSAAGYIAKYIGKNIDGHGVDVDHESGLDGADGAERATAWASVHGIRQFQQIGGPSVGLWRELRRLRDPIELPEIEAARVHTSKPACWSKFIDEIGGIAAGRKTTLQTWKQLSLDLNRYGERRAPQVVGVQAIARHLHIEQVLDVKRFNLRKRRIRYVETCEVLARIRTRIHQWRIERKTPERGKPSSWDLEMRSAGVAAAPVSSLGPVSITVRESISVPSRNVAGGHARGDPWMH